MEQIPVQPQIGISERRAVDQQPVAAPSSKIRLVGPANTPAFRRFVGKRFSGWVRSDFKDESCLDSPNGFEQLRQAEQLVERPGRSIVRVPLEVGGRPQNCFVHHFLNDTVSRCLQRSYASRVLELSVKLGESGFDSIEVVAAVRRKHTVLNRESLVVALEIPNVSEIAARKNERSRIQKPSEFTSRMASSLAGTIAKMHEQGFFHGDLKTRHVLVTLDAPYRFHFIDLESCQHRPRLPRYARDLFATRDIIQLFSSLPAHEVTDNISSKERFLADYFAARQLPSSRADRILNWIAMYGPKGKFRQGRTLLDNLIRVALSYVPRPRSKTPTGAGPRPTEPKTRQS